MFQKLKKMKRKLVRSLRRRMTSNDYGNYDVIFSLLDDMIDYIRAKKFSEARKEAAWTLKASLEALLEFTRSHAQVQERALQQYQLHHPGMPILAGSPGTGTAKNLYDVVSGISNIAFLSKYSKALEASKTSAQPPFGYGAGFGGFSSGGSRGDSYGRFSYRGGSRGSMRSRASSGRVQASGGGRPRFDKDKDKCFKCGDVGHMAWQCAGSFEKKF